MHMQRLVTSSVAQPLKMQRLYNSFLVRKLCFACKHGQMGPGSNCLGPALATVQAKGITSAFLPHCAALPTTLTQHQLLRRRSPGTEHMHPSLPCTADARMHIFSAAGQARRETRSKWLEAAQAVAGRSVEEEANKPPQPQRFIVDGSEIHLSTSPTIPGHSNAQYKGLVEGSAVRGRSVLEIWKQQLQQQLGGEQQLLHDLLRETRTSALQRLAEAAAAVGANAVVSVRLVTSGLQSMHVEYTAYGTAVRVTRANTASSP